jgi:ferredoxin
MAYKITDKCIACGACAGECPVSCITQGDSIYVIDNEQCISCRSMCRNLPSGSTRRRIENT